jgi:hypothetical protein
MRALKRFPSRIRNRETTRNDRSWQALGNGAAGTVDELEIVGVEEGLARPITEMKQAAKDPDPAGEALRTEKRYRKESS